MIFKTIPMKKTKAFSVAPLWALMISFLILASCQSGTEGEASRDSNKRTEFLEGILAYCPPCSPGNMCDPLCKEALLGCHTISEEEFNRRVLIANPGNNPFPTVVDFCDLINGGDCQTEAVLISADMNNPSNQDIKVCTLTIQNALEGDYSVIYPLSLFKGICETNPIEVTFHKGQRGSGGADVLIRVLKADGEFAYFNLSDTTPPHISPCQ